MGDNNNNNNQIYFKTLKPGNQLSWYKFVFKYLVEKFKFEFNNELNNRQQVE